MVVKSGVVLEPLIMGGGQERDRRSGTSNVAGIVATAAALRETVEKRRAESARVGALRKALISAICAKVPDVLDTVSATTTSSSGESSSTVSGVAHLCFADVESEALLFLLDEAGVCASAASACASGAMEPSHVLRAMGVEPRFAKGALRLSFGHTTTEDDITHAVSAIVSSVSRLRTKQ